MMTLPGLPEPLPVRLLPRRAATPGTETAWLGEHHTVQLLAPLAALRVHQRGGTAAASAPGPAWGAGTWGNWFAIGDVVLSRSQYAARYALPGAFTHQDEWQLPAGTVMNVGIAGPLFGHDGGGLQAQRLDGPPLQRRRLHGYWVDRVGSA